MHAYMCPRACPRCRRALSPSALRKKICGGERVGGGRFRRRALASCGRLRAVAGGESGRERQRATTYRYGSGGGRDRTSLGRKSCARRQERVRSSRARGCSRARARANERMSVGGFEMTRSRSGRTMGQRGEQGASCIQRETRMGARAARPTRRPSSGRASRGRGAYSTAHPIAETTVSAQCGR